MTSHFTGALSRARITMLAAANKIPASFAIHILFFGAFKTRPWTAVTLEIQCFSAHGIVRRTAQYVLYYLDDSVGKEQHSGQGRRADIHKCRAMVQGLGRLRRNPLPRVLFFKELHQPSIVGNPLLSKIA
ncbi:uncharacterized protein LACBIDRAFT_294385 [Laccaria bicolor S238N-H82]|uniref:Predicted protein n=1 Tax=Laccaria bicolor (strain S238N-H82 / ATCC MYA-4686) TaxID=486041 RepID=B0DAQ3_LACBS|nr:uncharacterized protein LACBIDRAFT_294385 [Laccaria bicolor S238N-H82]EDR08251.1 predicted protein [Laccaria bicolor S238N-H82]|eukprot:XP_001881321.1 predicted protein [Laccaria bicolor S238N-H82]